MRNGSIPARGLVLPKTLCSAGLLLLLTLAAYGSASSALWGYWVAPDSGGSHGFLIAPICLGLLWRARFALSNAPIRGSLTGCILLLCCGLAWLVFLRSGIQDLQLLLLPPILFLAAYAAFGFRAAWVLAFPIGYLGFALPAWGTLGGPLQELTTWAVGAVMPVIGLPARVSGFLVHLPNGTFEIAYGCSGINFLVVGLAIAALLGELQQAPIRRRALLLVAAGLLAITANWVRVLAIIAIGYVTNMHNGLVTGGHLLFGWVLFAIILVGYIWMVTRHLPEVEGKPTPVSPGDQTAQVQLRLSYLAPALLALAVAPGLEYTLGSSRSMAHESLSAPAGRASWRGPQAVASSPWRPVFVGSDVHWQVAYSGTGGRDVEMVGVGYAAQEQGHELVNEGNSLLGNGALTVVHVGVVKAAGNAFTEEVVVDGQGRRSVVWSVYDIAGRHFVVPLLSQLWYGVRSLGGATYSALFAFRASCEPTCDAARQTLGLFLQDMTTEVFDVAVREPSHSATSEAI